MKFKKYADYVESKESVPNVGVRFDRFLKDVEQKLAGLVLRKNEFYEEAKRLLINLTRLEGFRSDFADNIRIAMASGNVESMRDCLGRCGGSINGKDRAYLESCVLNYESKLMGRMFTASDVDICVQTLREECESLLERLRARVVDGLRVVGLSHLDVDIEVDPPAELRAETATATFGGLFPFRLVFDLDDMSADSAAGDLPVKVREDHDRLLGYFRGQKGTPSYFIGYLVGDSGLKELCERKQKEVALGMKTFVETGTVLHARAPAGNFDVWQVKVKNPKMSDSDGAHRLSEDAQLRWMQLIRRQRNEG